MSVKVVITPTSVKFIEDGDDPEIPWLEDEINEVVIRNPAGRDITFTYPPAQSGESVREDVPPERNQTGRGTNPRPGTSNFHDVNGVYDLPHTD